MGYNTKDMWTKKTLPRKLDMGNIPWDSRIDDTFPRTVAHWLLSPEERGKEYILWDS
jgi:hypothetical protein